jgi:hypothetical protein
LKGKPLSFDHIALLWAAPFLALCLALAVLMIAADWESRHER